MFKKLAWIVVTVLTTEWARRAVARAVDRADARAHRNQRTDQRHAVARWEDEGGAVVAPSLPVPTQSAQAQANLPRDGQPATVH